MANKLKDKVAIVTGASKGIGASIAEHLAEEGASVVINYSTSKEGADRIVNSIKQKGGNAIAVQGNMSNPQDVERLFTETQKVFKKLDILVNNAGIYEFIPIEEIRPEQYYKIFDLNVLGLILSCQQAVKYFGKSGGSIVNISSIASSNRLANSTVYSASKGAVDAITRALAAELGPRKIRVNAVNPGMVQTEGTISSGITESDLRKAVEAQTPLGRIGVPKDVSPAVVFLASDDASWITGETFFITGGLR
jgi:3-oxoacyl-[acyl-carrier protein] reductase